MIRFRFSIPGRRNGRLIPELREVAGPRRGRLEGHVPTRDASGHSWRGGQHLDGSLQQRPHVPGKRSSPSTSGVLQYQIFRHCQQSGSKEGPSLHLSPRGPSYLHLSPTDGAPSAGVCFGLKPRGNDVGLGGNTNRGAPQSPLPNRICPLHTKLGAVDSDRPYCDVPCLVGSSLQCSSAYSFEVAHITYTTWAIVPKDYHKNPVPRDRSEIPLIAGYLHHHTISSARLGDGVRTP
ncbi:hypothetical protein NDU88_000704 [Pleurodeles waltl]|uniref:Uncharacterized protein n=1 Tax=Pleurodeles waltl TaxID=8319 RepID=A0AAV7LWK6_PLEWA|nr:hypothetical protein NDU88_000704 [Pleurodeles waltl]